MGTLVLERHVNEEIVVTVPPSSQEQKISVKICKIYQKKVKIGFVAHREIVIHRKEVQEIIDNGYKIPLPKAE